MFSWEIKFFSELSALRLYQILKLRQDVFILEQSCLYADIDDIDQKSIHILLISEEDDELIAYCRILPQGIVCEYTAIGRVVISPSSRQQGIARKLMKKAMDFVLEEMQVEPIKISAQSHLQPFYESLGFVASSEIYDEDGIDHIDMLFRQRNLVKS